MLIIRPWQESDRPFLRTLFLHSRRANLTWLDGSDWKLEYFDSPTIVQVILVAAEDGIRKGFAAVHVLENFLHSLFVDPAFQVQWLGSPVLAKGHAEFTSTRAL